MAVSTLFTYYFVIPEGMKSENIPDYFFCVDLEQVQQVIQVLDTHLDDALLEDARVTIIPLGMTAKQSLEMDKSGSFTDDLYKKLFPTEGTFQPGELYDRILIARRLKLTDLFREVAIECMLTFKRYETIRLKRRVAELEIKLAAAEKEIKGRVA